MADIVSAFPTSIAMSDNGVQRIAEATVYAASDPNLTTPLAITDLQGVPYTGGKLTTTTGQFPQFRAPAGVTQVLVKSGDRTTLLTDLSVYAGAAIESATAAAGSAGEAEIARVAAALERSKSEKAAADAKAVGATTDQQMKAVLDNPTAEFTKAQKATFAPISEAATTNKRTMFRDTPVFDSSFPFNAIFAGADGAFVWKQMQVSGGYGGAVGEGGAISYFKAIGGSINHTGPGNIDVFWSSMQHRGPREAGIFIGDVTSRRGGNAYGGHTRVVVEPDAGYGAPLYQASWSHEIFVGAERQAGQVAYGELIDIQGRFAASAAIQIGAQAHTGDKSTAAKSPVVYGINFDSTVASPLATAIMIGGSWGSGLNMNANSIVQAGSITGVGSSPNRDVRVADNLLLDNGRHVKFRDTGGTARKAFGVTSSDNARFIAAASNKQWEFYDPTETTLLARITGSGRGDFSAAGVTTKYTSGAAAPSFLSNGQVEVWHDTASGNDYLVVNVNGVIKKASLA